MCVVYYTYQLKELTLRPFVQRSVGYLLSYILFTILLCSFYIVLNKFLVRVMKIFDTKFEISVPTQDIALNRLFRQSFDVQHRTDQKVSF